MCTDVHTIEPMEPEWDAKKAASNWRKHRIDFADAATVLHDETALTRRDPHPTEERFVTLGFDAQGRLLAVVYTYRSERVRLISARRATRNEEAQYHEDGR
jgi:uncharacterized DUF497 family protein